MYKLCKTEQSAIRQRELERGLLELMKTKRYEDISVSELCNLMNIPRKTFYRYFSSKDGALFALLDHTMMEFSFSDKNQQSAITDLDTFFSFWYQRKEILDVLSRSSLSGILVERATDLALRERMIPKKFLNLNNNMKIAAMSFAVCGIMIMVIQWHHQGFQETPAQMSALAIALLSKPLLP